MFELYGRKLLSYVQDLEGLTYCHDQENEGGGGDYEECTRTTNLVP
jgi:hypothetical protein